MRFVKLVALGSLALSLAACGATATTAPGAAGSASPPASALSSASAAAGSPGSGSSASAGDITGLALTPTAKMCALLTTDEAKSIIGKDIAIPPSGVLFQGLGSNCIWQTDDTMAPATFIKVEINPISYKANTDLVTLGSAATQITVGGFDATAVDVGGFQKDASLVVKLDPVKAVSMLIQAPTLDMAKAVAEKVLVRLATLK